MIRGIWAYLLIFTIVNCANAQIRKANSVQNFKIQLSKNIADVEQQQLLQVLPLFMIKGDSIHQPIDFSADKPGMKLQQVKIVVPNGLSNGIHAYGFSYNQHGIPPFPNHTLIFVERPSGLQTQPTRVWADVNHDLDFSNDTFVVFKPSKPTVLPLSSNKSKYSIELTTFRNDEFASFQSMYKSAIDLIRGDRVYFGTQFSFREKRLNTAYGVLNIGDDTIYIGVKDVNSNGSYKDADLDRVVLSPSIQRFELDNSKPLTNNLRLNWLGKSFKLITVSAENELIIEYDPKYRPTRKEIKLSKSLLVGQKFPRLKFCLAIKKKSTFTKTRKRIYSYKPDRVLFRSKHAKRVWPDRKKFDSIQTLIVVWNAYDKQWDLDSSLVHQLARLPKNKISNLQVIMLNFGGSGKYVHRYNQRYELNNAIQGFCSADLARKFKIQTMPQYFLLDSRFNVLEINPKLNQIQR